MAGIKQLFLDLEEGQEAPPGIDYEQTFRKIGPGHVVKGCIVSVSPKEVIVDIGFKSEGIIPAHEFDSLETLNVGDIVEVLLEETENETGRIVVSKRKAEKSQGWDRIVEKSRQADTEAANEC